MAGIIAKKMQEPPQPDGSTPHEMAEGEEPQPQEAGQPEEESEGKSKGGVSFKDALKFAMAALYENGGAKNVAQALAGQQDKVQALADTAFKMVEVVDERTQAKVPEDELVLLAIHILQEVIDIGGAAQIQYSPSEIASAFKQMVLMFVESQGMDATELRAAMDGVDTEQFNNMAMDEGAPPEEMPA